MVVSAAAGLRRDLIKGSNAKQDIDSSLAQTLQIHMRQERRWRILLKLPQLEGNWTSFSSLKMFLLWYVRPLQGSGRRQQNTPLNQC